MAKKELSEYIADVKRYDANGDMEVVGSIVKHLGIALQSRDASLVSCTDPSELERVRESWCKKKLGVEFSDDQIDAAIKDVCETMKADHNKQRVTFYYLLAKHYDKMSLLV